MENQTSSIENTSRIKTRLLGLAMLLGGLAWGYFYIYLKVVDMQAGVENLSYSAKAMLLAPLAAVGGLYYFLFLPAGLGGWADLQAKEKPMFVVMIVAMVVAMVGVYFWFSGQLSLYGYS